MGKKAMRTTVANPPISVMELAKDLDPDTAGYIEFLLMETKVTQALLADHCSKLGKTLPYDDVLRLIAQIGIQSSMLAHYYQELDQALDKILTRAPDVEEG